MLACLESHNDCMFCHKPIHEMNTYNKCLIHHADDATFAKFKLKLRGVQSMIGIKSVKSLTFKYWISLSAFRFGYATRFNLLEVACNHDSDRGVNTHRDMY